MSFKAKVYARTHTHTTDNPPWHKLRGLRPVELKMKVLIGQYIPRTDNISLKQKTFIRWYITQNEDIDQMVITQNEDIFRKH